MGCLSPGLGYNKPMRWCSPSDVRYQIISYCRWQRHTDTSANELPRGFMQTRVQPATFRLQVHDERRNSQHEVLFPAGIVSSDGDRRWLDILKFERHVRVELVYNDVTHTHKHVTY